MKNIFSPKGLTVDRVFSVVMAALVAVSALSGVMFSDAALTVGAEAAEFDSENHPSYKELVNEDFTDGSLTEGVWVDPYEAAKLDENGKGLIINNPNPNFTVNGTGSSFLSNILWVTGDAMKSADQHISAEVDFSENPASWNNNQFLYLWGRTSPGASFGGQNRGDHNKNADGYYLRISTKSNMVISVMRRSGTADIGIMNLCADGSTCIATRPGTYRFELNITGSNPVVINARILEKNGNEWRVVASNTAYDNSDKQIASGGAGLGMDKYGYANGYIKNFRYITTDVAQGEDTYNYVEKTSVDPNNLLFAQVVTLNPAKKYKLTAYTVGLSNDSLERFWVEYNSTSGANQNGKQRVYIDVPSVSLQDGYYVASSKAFCINDHVSQKGAAAASASSDFKWGTTDSANNDKNVARVQAIVGFRLSNNAKATAKFTRFELHEVDGNGASVGPNLILNPDFKLGLYGWNDSQEYRYKNYTTGEVGDSISAKGVVTCYTCTEEEYLGMFRIADLDMNNTYYTLTKDKKLNILYMGGSVTSGYGADPIEENSWRALTNKWFKDNYPDCNISSVNAAVGSMGSHFAVYNYGEISENDKPDLLFIDSAINDSYLYSGATNPQSGDAYNNTLRNLESLIRNAIADNPNVDIVLVITFDHWNLSSYPSADAMEDLAKKYQLPCIDLRLALKARAEADGRAWNSEALKPYRTNDPNDGIEQLYRTDDGVHPNNAGYKIFADYVTDYLGGYMDKAEEKAPTELVAKSLSPETLSSVILNNPTVVKANEIPLSTGWELTSNGFSNIGTAKFGGIYGSAVTSNTVGSTLTFEFTGTEFGFIAEKGADCGKLYVEVDGVAYKYDKGVVDLNGRSDKHTRVIATGLKDTEHTVTLKALQGTGGNRVTIGAYYINGTFDPEQGKEEGGTTEGWMLSGTAKLNGANLKLDGSTADDSYLTNYAFKTAENVNQRISVETQVTLGQPTEFFSPVLWLRADFDDPQDSKTVTGYYAVYGVDSPIEVYKRFKDGEEYKDVLIGKLYHDNSTRKFRYELVVEAVGTSTRITVTVSKYGGDGTTLYLMSRNTFLDDTPALQDAGYAGVSLKLNKEQNNTACQMEYEYNAFDGEVDNNLYVSKPKDPSKSMTFGQMLALDPSKTYVLSGLATADNQKLFVEYNSADVDAENTFSGNGSYTRIVTNTAQTDLSSGYRRIYAEFNIDEFAAENGTKAAYVKAGHMLGDTKLVIVNLGFRLNNGKDMAYTDITLYEKDDPLKRNLLTNSDFKMGLYGWGELNSQFISHNLATVNSNESYKGYVKLLSCDDATYNALFKTATDENVEEEFDYKNYNGDYMLYCYDESTASYGKFGQIIEIEKGKTYVYSVKYKYILQKQVAPIALYYKDASMDGKTRATLKWKTEEKDLDNSTLIYTFTAPEDAFFENNKTKVLVGLTLGEIGGMNYFRDFKLYDAADSSKTNLFTNADFKQGLYGWIHTTGYTITPEAVKNVYKDSELALVILPADDTLFINDTNDRKWNDGAWHTKFGPDDEVITIDDETNLPIENVETEPEEEEASSGGKQLQQILATRKVRTKGKVNVPATVGLIGGITAAVAAATFAVIIIIKRKKNR